MLKKFDEKERLKEVNSYKIGETLSEKEYDDIAFLASVICGTPIALVTFMFKDRQWFKAAIGTDLKENKRELSFCTHAIAGEEDVMVVENANEDVRFIHNPLVQGSPKLVFYAGAPIITKNGYSIGTVCVYDVIKKSLTNEQINGLKILSEQVMGLLELRKQNLRLENNIHQQFDARKLIEASENQFRIFANSIQNLAWIANGDGWIYWYNQQWYDYTGTTFEEMEGWGWEKVHHPDHINGVTEFVKKAWKKDEAFELTFPLRKHNGEYSWFLTRAYPVKDANGNIERWIGTNTDITKQKSFTEELEIKVNERTEELNIKNLELENTNAELASFSYVASHDLKEPLRKIQTFSRRILETENFSDKTQAFFNRIISAAERMQNLLDSLLDFSRANSTDLFFKPCDLNIIIEESKQDLYERIVENKAVIEYDNLPVINGVDVQLLQLFTNLIDNAIKYRRPNVIPRIKIKSNRIWGSETEYPEVIKQKEYYEIKIEDNGIGYEKEYTTKIFEVFQRLHNKDEFSGTGIGLAIVKKIVTNHKGFIRAEGNPNVGSIFTLYLPVS